jgi:transposase InsO family protein
MSRIEIEALQQGINWKALANSQQTDATLQALLIKADSSLQLKLVQLPGLDESIYCDVSTACVRPYVTEPFRRIAFNSIHQLSHPGAKATTKLMTQKFIWPSIKSDCRKWTKSCLQCQRSKVTRHVTSPLGSFALPSARFEHVHIDIVVMPVSEGYRYVLTCVDRFSRWPEAIPIENQEAETVARAFYSNWIARFGTPLRITTDQGRQFESHLFRNLCILTGTSHLRTTAYHPEANGMVERLHRQLKAAIKCHQDIQWTQVLPTVLLGIRAAWKEDLQATPAEMVYGETIRLPGEFLGPRSTTRDDYDATNFVKQLRDNFNDLQPVPGSHHTYKNVFVFKDLLTASHVFVRVDSARKPLQQPYVGPYAVISRSEKKYVINIRGRHVTVSVDRLKPAYVMSDNMQNPPEGYENFTQFVIQRQSVPNRQAEPTTTQSTTDSNRSTGHMPKSNGDIRQTKSGRKVRFPDYYQAGLC